MNQNDIYRKGFTIIELLVVLAISALLSGLAISYSSIGRNQVALSIEVSKIAQFILQAKELSISTYTSNSASCGYGVVIDMARQSYSIFAYSPTGAPPCPNASSINGITASDEQQYTAGTWQVPISRGVIAVPAPDNLVTVLFYPPNPAVFLSTDNQTFSALTQTLRVHLQTIDSRNSAAVSVNPEGQVSF